LPDLLPYSPLSTSRGCYTAPPKSQPLTTSAHIPPRSVFRAQEVCEIADVQPYVLRTWEAEFSDLGMAKGDGPRMYRRGDVERVLRIKHLLFVDGLTMAGVRRRLSEEGPAPEPEAAVAAEWADAIDGTLRERLRDVRGGLQSILSMLSGKPRAGGHQVGSFRLQAPGGRTNGGRSHEVKTKSAVKGKAGVKPAVKVTPKPAARRKAASKSKVKARAKSKPAAVKGKRPVGARKR